MHIYPARARQKLCQSECRFVPILFSDHGYLCCQLLEETRRKVAHLSMQDVHEAASCVLSDALAGTTSFYPLDQFAPVPGGDPEAFEPWRTKHRWAEHTPPKWHHPSDAEVTPSSSVCPVVFEKIPPVLLVYHKLLDCKRLPSRAQQSCVSVVSSVRG